MDNVMNAKEYLSQVYRLDQRINAKLEQILQLRSLAERRTVAYGGECVSRTRNVHSMEDTVAKIIEAEKLLDAEIDGLISLKAEIQSAIDSLPDPDCRVLLEMRYLAMQRWMDIAAEMGISRCYADRLHNKALDMMEVVLRDRRVKDEEGNEDQA